MARQLILIATCCFVLVTIASAMSTSRGVGAFERRKSGSQLDDQDITDELALDRVGSGDETDDQSQEDITGDFQVHNNVNLQRKLFDIKWMAMAAEACKECIKQHPQDKKSCAAGCALLGWVSILGEPPK